MKFNQDPASTKLAAVIAAALDDGKAVDIRLLDVGRLTIITDYMVVASGRSSRQVRALTDRVQEAARSCATKVIGVEGAREGEWVLIDLGGVIVHIMQPAARDFYQLEKLWEQRSPAQADAG